MFDGKAFGEDIVGIVKGYVEREIAPLKAENVELKGRIAELEARPAQLDSVFVLQLVQEEISKIPPPENGKDADPEQVASLVAEEVERAVAAIPAPQDGKSVAVEDVAPLITEEVAKVAPDMLAINEAIAEAVSKAVAAIRVPEDGKDAAGIVEALKDSGELVLTLADGRLVRTGIRDGEKGSDGRDGFSLDDFDVEAIDERTVDLRFTQGDTVHAFELKFPVPVYRNVFKQGETYVRGDVVTWGGCAWHCEKETAEKPEQGENWALMVKRGRDGKDMRAST
jgi:hypothetical protein